MSDLTNQKSILTQENIEKTIYRCFENYWNTKMNKKHNLARVLPIAAQDIMRLIEQEIPSEYLDLEVKK